MKSARIILGAIAAIALSACTGAGTPEVTPAPTEPPTEVAADVTPPPSETPSPEPTEQASEEPVVSVGTRETPLQLGESRKIATNSAWTVSITVSDLDAAEAIAAADEWAPKPEAGERFVVATLWVKVDGAAIEAQGFDLSNDGADPRASITVSYVAADGTSFNAYSQSWCITSNSFDEAVGEFFQDGAEGSGDVCIVVPEEKADGGLWRVSNSVNDSVWFHSTEN